MTAPPPVAGPVVVPHQRRAVADLDALLDALVDDPSRAAAVTEEVHRRFGVECAVVVVDMCGFSRTTRSLGVVPFLAMIRTLQRIVEPAVTDAGGRVLKADADNVWCVLPSVPLALAAVDRVLDRLAAVNVAVPVEQELHVSVAVGHGRILLVDRGDGGDLFGDEVNVVGKLGEDLAGPDEVLLTAAAAASVDPGLLRPQHVAVSGLELDCYALTRQSLD